jgi:hypothetical protein
VPALTTTVGVAIVFPCSEISAEIRYVLPAIALPAKIETIAMKVEMAILGARMKFSLAANT